MRRSGTTILFDCLYEDKRFDSYYESFCYGKINVGGGSGMKNVAFGKKLNSIRKEFISQEKLAVSPEFFNLGAPRDFKQELKEEILPIFKDYLKFIASKSNFTLMKFVRVSHKMRALHKLFPDARIIHIVKDPRRVAISHIFGKTNKRGLVTKQRIKQFVKQKLYNTTFFYRKTGFNTWSSENLINHVIKRNPKYRTFKNSPAFEKIMLLWKVFYQKTRADGRRYFSSNYLEVQLEELCNNPSDTLDVIYNHLQLSCPKNVKNWANSNVRPPKSIYRQGDRRWVSSAKRIEIDLDSWNVY